jgi:hypothetical protein
MRCKPIIMKANSPLKVLYKHFILYTEHRNLRKTNRPLSSAKVAYFLRAVICDMVICSETGHPGSQTNSVELSAAGQATSFATTR